MAKERVIAFARLLPGFLDQLGVGRCPVIACGFSTSYAFAAVNENPERYAGLVLAGMRLPLAETLDRQAMNPAWRAPLEVGGRFPGFFEFFTRTIFRLAMRGEVQRYFDRLLKDSPLDLKTLREPDIANMIRFAAERRTDRFGAAIAQGFVAMALDWSDWLSAINVHVKLIVGGQDVIAKPCEMQNFAKRNGFQAIGPVDHIGGFGLLQDPALILREAADFIPSD